MVILLAAIPGNNALTLRSVLLERILNNNLTLHSRARWGVWGDATARAVYWAIDGGPFESGGHVLVLLRRGYDAVNYAGSRNARNLDDQQLAVAETRPQS